MAKFSSGIALLMSMAGPGCMAAERLVVGDFSTRGLAGWEEHSFKGNTEYSLVDMDGTRVIKAVSVASASVLVREVGIDLEKTPYLHWRWRIESAIDTADETTKSGDDYPARIYIVSDLGVFPWQKRSVNYVWASKQPRGSVWPSAYTSLSQMVAVRSGPGEAGRWVGERRNVRDDFRKLFNEEIRYVRVIALMTDTDDTGETAGAYYGDVFFSGD